MDNEIMCDNGINETDSEPITHQYQMAMPTTQHFFTDVVHHNIKHAISSTVNIAIQQTTVLPPNITQIHPQTVQLFLNIAQLLFQTGQICHQLLADVLQPIMLTTAEQYKSIPNNISTMKQLILNKTNKHAFVSQLPKPKILSLCNNNAIANIQDVIALFLMWTAHAKTFTTVSSHLMYLKNSSIIHDWLSNINVSKTYPIGILLWCDGWDPNRMSKANRESVWSTTMTLLRFDTTNVNQHIVQHVTTYLIATSRAKAQHDNVFASIRDQLTTMTSTDSTKQYYCSDTKAWKPISVKLLAVLQDQMERRPASCLQQGNSNLHAYFGISCDFGKLTTPFHACSNCAKNIAKLYTLSKKMECTHRTFIFVTVTY